MLHLSHCLEDQSRLICPSNIPWMSLQEYKYYSKLGLPYISIFTVFKASWWEADNVAASRWALFRFVRAVQFIVHGSKMLELSCCLLNLDTFWEHHKYTCIHITHILFNIIYLYVIYIYTYIVKKNKKISGDICRQHQQIMHAYIYIYVYIKVSRTVFCCHSCLWFLTCLNAVSCKLPAACHPGHCCCSDLGGGALRSHQSIDQSRCRRISCAALLLGRPRNGDYPRNGDFTTMGY